MHVPAVQRAVLEFRERHGVRSPVLPVFLDYIYGCSAGELPPSEQMGLDAQGLDHPHTFLRVLPNQAFWFK